MLTREGGPVAQVTTGAVALNCLFVSKLGSRWGISGRWVGEPGRKAPRTWCFPGNWKTKKGWGVFYPQACFFPFRRNQPGSQRGGPTSFNFKGFPLVHNLCVCPNVGPSSPFFGTDSPATWHTGHWLSLPWPYSRLLLSASRLVTHTLLHAIPTVHTVCNTY